jgi:hypothetical protein
MQKLPHNLKSSETSGLGRRPTRAASNMSAEPISQIPAYVSQIPAHAESDIETLARETDTPVAIVREIYQIEHAKLDRLAKIKTYVPVLIRRRVKERLQTQLSATAVGGP